MEDAALSGRGVLVVVPTYDERENLPVVLERVLSVVPEAHVLVVDDNSPDGTGELADEIAAADERVLVLHRVGKLGLGSAYLEAFAHGLENGFDHIVEIDADGSHPPGRLPALIRAAQDTKGVALGSRWVPGGSVVRWPLWREALSRGANLYSRLVLGIQVRDATAGYRVYPAEVLRAVDLDGVDSKGYCFQIDMTLRTLDAGFGVVELPIEFRERVHGDSKMSRSIVGEAMLRVTLWGLARRLRRR